MLTDELTYRQPGAEHLTTAVN